MYFEALLFIFVLMFLESQLMKWYRRDLFTEIFHLHWKYALIIAAVMLSLFVLPADKLKIFVYGIFTLFCPIYLLKRREFFSLDNNRPELSIQAKSKTEKWYLCFEGIQTIVNFVFSMIIFSVLFRETIRIFNLVFTEIDELIIGAVFSTTVAAIIIYRSASKFSPSGFWRNVGFNRDKSFFKRAIIPAIVGFVCACSSAYVAVTRDVQPSTPLNESLQTADNVLVIVGFFILALIIAPLFEEIVFRGYFYHISRRIIGKVSTVILIGATFAAMHVGQYWGDWLAIFMVAVVGFAITILRAWTGTTSSGVIAHYVYNIGVTVITTTILMTSNPAYFEYEANYPNLNTEEKIVLLEKSIETRPEFADAYNDLAWLYAEEGVKLDQAMELVDKALYLSPDEPMYLDTKAEIYQKFGLFSKETEMRQRVIEFSDNKDLIERQQQRLRELQDPFM